ncbi:MAG: GrpB family protein [Betaproteobacteria bacterium]
MRAKEVQPLSVRIEPHDAAWSVSFRHERDLLARTIGPWLAGPIEHVGSTAVPGLPAKPVVDIMAAVESLEASKPAIGQLASIGYCYAPYRCEVMHWLCKPGPDIRTHHLHLVPFGSELWQERLAFRDLLRHDAGTARDYAALKQRLAAMYSEDRERYTEEKGPFIREALRAAGWRPVRLAPYSHDWPRQFESQAAAIAEAFAPEPVALEHIGSTAVPGMAAKPVVDILLGAASLEVIERRIEVLGRHGYRYVPELEGELPQRRYFVSPAAGEARFHLHAVEREGDFWRDHVAFRDALRADRRAFDEYLALKRRLAASGMGRAAYTEAKAPFIRRVLSGVVR